MLVLEYHASGPSAKNITEKLVHQIPGRQKKKKKKLPVPQQELLRFFE